MAKEERKRRQTAKVDLRHERADHVNGLLLASVVAGQQIDIDAFDGEGWAYVAYYDTHIVRHHGWLPRRYIRDPLRVIENTVPAWAEWPI